MHGHGSSAGVQERASLALYFLIKGNDENKLRARSATMRKGVGRGCFLNTPCIEEGGNRGAGSFTATALTLMLWNDSRLGYEINGRTHAGYNNVVRATALSALDKPP
jgi:hypothetical protein